MIPSKELIGHWPLSENGNDHSGHNHHGQCHHVMFENGAATFNGRNSAIEIPNPQAPHLATQTFTLSAWIHTNSTQGDTPGDILSKYDPITRRGFNLNIQTLSGVTSAQSNYKHLHFGIDHGQTDPIWHLCGRPGNAIFICALTVYHGHLYAGTFETGVRESGHVYRYTSDTTWEDCGSPHPCNAVMSLSVWNGKLYAGVAHYRSAGSALSESDNQTPGGHIYRYEGNKTWIDCGKLNVSKTSIDPSTYASSLTRFAAWTPDEIDSVYAMAVFKNQLYAIPLYHQGIFCYNGNTWEDCGSPGVRLMALTVYNGHLYGAGNEGNKRGGVYRYDGEKTWTRTGDQLGVDQTYSFAIYEQKLYVGTWPEARVFRYDGENNWTSCGRLGNELEVMGMAVYNGKLYAGTLPLAEVYRYEGDTHWTTTGQLDHTPDVTYRRAWSMAVYKGKLFCGTLPSGQVFSMEAGQNVTNDTELPSGWQHIVATRAQNQVHLYINGRLVSSSTPHQSATYDISNTQPFKIGAGQTNAFCGRIADVRLYNHPLSPSEIATLANRPNHLSE